MRFTCKVQLANHDPGEAIDKGEIDFQQFQSEFNSIDWEFESDRLQVLDESWPTIGVTNLENDAVLWASAYRPLPPDFLDEDEIRQNMAIWFAVGIENPASLPEMTSFDMSKRLADRGFETYNEGDIEQLFRLFFDENYKSLYELLFSIEVPDVVH